MFTILIFVAFREVELFNKSSI